jgi:hypothetical protein
MLCMTAVVLFLGYGQWRRQRILKLCEKLSYSHVDVIRPNTWIDKLWQRKPYGATVSAFDVSPNLRRYITPTLSELGIEGKVVAASDSKRHLAVEEVRNGNAFRYQSIKNLAQFDERTWEVAPRKERYDSNSPQ